MSFEYILEKENTKKKLTDGEAEEVARLISRNYDMYDQARQPNLDIARQIMDDVFFKSRIAHNGKKNDKDNWKTQVKMGKTYMFYQVLKAYIWKNVYANVSSMFDVSGENQEATNSSNLQKANLVEKLEKMNISQTLDKIIDRAIFYSELIAFAGWKKKYKKVRRPIDVLLQNETNPEKIEILLQEKENGNNYYIDTQLIYDSPYIYDVNPANFVFDVTQKDDWTACPKIYRTFKTPENIINNKLYTISKDDKDAIKELAKETNTSILSNQADDDLQDVTNNGRTVEVLEHWGDLKLKNGDILHNWHAVVVAGKYLVCFEENKRIINPFTFATLFEDTDTKRGISLLYCIFKNSQLQDELMSRTCNLQALNENPPVFAPKGYFDEDEIEIFPGQIREYGDNLNPQNAFKQMEFNSNIFLNDISILSDTMAETSGIYPNMAGMAESGNKTATEISTKTEGQLTRLSMIIDNINQNLIIPIVENVAELIANFQFGDENIYVNKNNQQELITITDEVRQADYRYTYSDRTMTIERANKADMTVQALKEFAQFIPLNVQEVFTWYMEQKGIENSERFIQQEQQLPQELQNELLARPEIQSLVQAFEQQRQEQQG